MIIIPFIINSLMFINVIPVSGDELIWISSLSTLWGAIIGGIISGTLTLIGVKMSVEASFDGLDKTIQHQENEKFKETVGLKLSKLFEVKKIIYTLDQLLGNRKYSWDGNHQKENENTINEEILKYLLPNFNLLLELSSSVDYKFYSEIKGFVDKARSIIYPLKTTDFNELTVMTEKLTKDIEENHEKRLSEKFKQVSE